ncbi:hypothetical protein B0H14DRAFT_2609131 [Mycena olivaceomarginata]|nr:hypothetical protein B0H14DRAFT_2609131 [Mycena olivaceomarginata]
MHIHEPHFGEVVSVSSTGRSVSTSSHAVHLHPSVPSYVQEDIQTNAAVESWEFGYDLGDTTLIGEVQDPLVDGIVFTTKRKVFENSDYPMLTWAAYQDEYLDEMLRLEGRGYPAIHSTCGGCQAAILHSDAPSRLATAHRYSVTNASSTATLSSRHTGSNCPNPLRANKNFVVIDLTGVHNVQVNFCLCDSRIEKRQQLMRACWWPATVRDPQTCATFGAVRLFQILNCQGKVSAHDFLRSLELLTNNDGLDPPP